MLDPTFLALALLALSLSAFVSGNPDRPWITPYNDCCKQSGSWIENGGGNLRSPVKVCDAKGNVIKAGPKGKSGCEPDGSGTEFSCPHMQPFMDSPTSTRALGFVAMSTTLSSADLMCSCWLVDIKPRTQALPWQNKYNKLKATQLFYQITNTGGLDDPRNVDLLVGSGGTGENQVGCKKQFGKSPNEDHWAANNWGKGIQDDQDCQALPLNADLRKGCCWRFHHFWDNPLIVGEPKRYKCDSRLLNKSGCLRKDEDKQVMVPTSPIESSGGNSEYQGFCSTYPDDFGRGQGVSNGALRGHHPQYNGKTHKENVFRWKQHHKG